MGGDPVPGIHEIQRDCRNLSALIVEAEEWLKKWLKIRTSALNLLLNQTV